MEQFTDQYSCRGTRSPKEQFKAKKPPTNTEYSSVIVGCDEFLIIVKTPLKLKKYYPHETIELTTKNLECPILQDDQTLIGKTCRLQTKLDHKWNLIIYSILLT